VRPYSRVYHELVDDPQFADVFGDDRAFGRWVKLLMVADAMWPASAPLPSRDAVTRQLVESGLVIEKPGNRYTIRGLDKERAQRRDSARIGAAARWQSKGNANAMPRRDETRQDEQGLWNGAGSHAGQHSDCVICTSMRKGA
jgi:hypothetical protein